MYFGLGRAEKEIEATEEGATDLGDSRGEAMEVERGQQRPGCNRDTAQV